MGECARCAEGVRELEAVPLPEELDHEVAVGVAGVRARVGLKVFAVDLRRRNQVRPHGHSDAETEVGEQLSGCPGVGTKGDSEVHRRQAMLVARDLAGERRVSDAAPNLPFSNGAGRLSGGW